MIIYPAIDLIDGNVVRLKQGDFSEQETFEKSPLEYALEFQTMGSEVLHLVDLQGAKEQKGLQQDVIREICDKSSLKVQTGGGIRQRNDIYERLDWGVDRVIIGSLVLKGPDMVHKWIQEFSPKRFTLSLDGKFQDDTFYLFSEGWTGDSKIDILEVLEDFSSYEEIRFLCTDIHKDGMMEGPSLKLYEMLSKKFPQVSFQASGGIRSLEDIKKLESLNMESCVCGKSLLTHPKLYEEWINAK